MKAVLLKTNVEGIQKRDFFRENILCPGIYIYIFFFVIKTQS